MRKILLNILVASIGLIVTLVLVEIVFRFFQKPAVQTTRSERPHFYFMPENSLTLRDAAPTTPKPTGTFRIAVVGDSFSFAPSMQYDDAFAKRLERFLNLNENATKVDVLNCGTPGHSTIQEVEQVRKAIQNEADLIIVQVTLNDAQVRPLNQEPEEVQRRFGRLKTNFDDSFILRHWKSLRFIIERLHNQQTIQSYIDFHRDLYEQPESWTRFSDSFADIKKMADAAHTPVVAVVFPLFDFPIDDAYPFSQIHKKIGDYVKSLAIPVLDLRAAFAQLSVQRLQLKPGRDSHPNEIAHRIAAEKMLVWLAKKKLIPSSSVPRKVFIQRDNVKEPLFEWNEYLEGKKTKSDPDAES